MARLNASAFGSHGPTDVLSFPIEHLTPGQVPDTERAPIVIGDVFLCPGLHPSPSGAMSEATSPMSSPHWSPMAFCIVLDTTMSRTGTPSLMEGRERELARTVRE